MCYLFLTKQNLFLYLIYTNENKILNTIQIVLSLTVFSTS